MTTEDDFKEFHRTRTRDLGRTKVILISSTTLFKAYSVLFKAYSGLVKVYSGLSKAYLNLF